MEPIYTLPPAMLSIQSFSADALPELYHVARKKLDATATEHRFGRDTVVAVIDSGVETKHPEFEGRILDALDMTGSKVGPEDAVGHGTHVSGTILGQTCGLARCAKLLAIKILDDSGVGRHDAVCRAFEKAIDAGVDVINVSLGSPMNSARLTELTTVCRDKGIVIVAAAGNDASTRLLYPAALDTCLAIGAIDRLDQWMPFSNYDQSGFAVDLVDYGDNIVSAYLGGAYKAMSGTSMSAPQVAACILLRMSAEYARLQSRRRWDLRQKYAMLERACRAIDSQGRSVKCGWGQFDTARLFGPERLPDEFLPQATEPCTAAAKEILSLLRDANGSLIVRADGTEFRIPEGKV